MSDQDDQAAWYRKFTQTYYQDATVADKYASRQLTWRSPVDWIIGNLEQRQILKGVKRFPSSQVVSILDVPAGSGKLSGLLSARSSEYVAGDISAPMLAHIGEQYETAVMDAAELPYEAGRFDLVVNLRLLHRVPPSVMAACVAEGIRVARRGMVLSYAGTEVSDIHRVLKRVSGRAENAVTRATREELVAMALASGARVLSDHSISMGITSERVAVLQKIT